MIEAIAQALRGQKQSDGSWNVLCPAHDDKNPSCNVKDAGGKLLVKCYAGCTQDAVIGAFKARNLWPKKANDTGKWFSTKPAGIMEKWHGKSLSCFWEYRDQSGVTIGYTARYDVQGGDKDIIPYFKRSGDNWKAGGPKSGKPIYGADRLSDTSKPVLIVEGEKAAAAAHKLVGRDFVCITWMGGTGSINKVDWSQIQGRDVFIWPDNDEPGTRAANVIKSKLPQSRIITPPAAVPEKWDLADAEADGWTRDKVAEHIKTAADGPGQEDGIKLPSGINAADLLNKIFPEPRWAVKEILPEGLTILGGKPKAGKSILALNLCLQIALGGKAMQLIQVERGTTLYLALEDVQRRLKERIGRMLEFDPAPANLMLYTEWPKLGEGGAKALDKILSDNPDTRLLVIDTLAKIRPPSKSNGNNMYSDDYSVIDTLKRIADKHEVSVLIVHHLRKMEGEDVFDTFSGTLGLTGAADSLMVMRRNNTGQMILSLRGRDIEEQEYVLEFDPWMFGWKIAGKAEEVQSTDSKQKLCDCLKDAGGPMTPTEMSKVTGLKTQYVKNTLPVLCKEGAVLKQDHGKYIYNSTIGTLSTISTMSTISTLDNTETEAPDKVPESTDGRVLLKPNTDKGLRPKVLKVLKVPTLCQDCKYADQDQGNCIFELITGGSDEAMPIDKAAANCPAKLRKLI